MIKIAFGKLGLAPMFFCDACGKPIERHQWGIVVFSRVKTGSIADAYYVHKGACDQAIHERHGQLPVSMELSDFLQYLLKGIGLGDTFREDKLDGILDVENIGFPTSASRRPSAARGRSASRPRGGSRRGTKKRL